MIINKNINQDITEDINEEKQITENINEEKENIIISKEIQQYINNIKEKNENIEIYVAKIKIKIDTELGYRFWKNYIKNGFWSIISLPINLSITMLTAITTGQGATDSLLPKNIFLTLTIIALVLSSINTYFKPIEKYNESLVVLKHWYSFGIEFENIHYISDSLEEKKKKYETLLKKIIDYKTSYLEDQNYITDFIHELLISFSLLKRENHWLKLDEDIKNNFQKKIPIFSNCCYSNINIEESKA
jgi:hypothetical protein